MNKIELEIVALSHSVAQSHSYAVVLGEIEGTRRLPIVIGGFEAQAIAVAMERMVPNRPLTHDLLKNFMHDFDIDLIEVVINKLQDGVFYSKLVCNKGGDIHEIDSRTSDALALAVRFGCPIYTFADILEQAGIVLQDTEDEGEEMPISQQIKVESKRELPDMSASELEGMLNAALENENYERAAKIRDELNRRQKDS